MDGQKQKQKIVALHQYRESKWRASELRVHVEFYDSKRLHMSSKFFTTWQGYHYSLSDPNVVIKTPMIAPSVASERISVYVCVCVRIRHTLLMLRYMERRNTGHEYNHDRSLTELLRLYYCWLLCRFFKIIRHTTFLGLLFLNGINTTLRWFCNLCNLVTLNACSRSLIIKSPKQRKRSTWSV